MKFKFFTILLLFSLLLLPADNSSYSFLTEEDRASLYSGEPLYSDRDDGLSTYYPRSPLSGRILADLENTDHYIVTEVLFYEPTSISRDSAGTLILLNKLLQISQQEGIEYFSHRKQRLVTLIEESFTLDSGDEGNHIDDHQLEDLPTHFDFFGYQDDAIFGGNNYSYSIETNETGLIMEMTNINSLRVMGLFTAFDEKDLKIRFIITNESDGLYAYAICYIEEIRPFVANQVDIGSAFRKRIEAVLNWYKNSL